MVSMPGPGGNGALLLAPLQLLDRLAALVPPPWVHCHRYFGALARTAACGQIGWRGRRTATGRKQPFELGRTTPLKQRCGERRYSV